MNVFPSSIRGRRRQLVHLPHPAAGGIIWRSLQGYRSGLLAPPGKKVSQLLPSRSALAGSNAHQTALQHGFDDTDSAHIVRGTR